MPSPPKQQRRMVPVQFTLPSGDAAFLLLALQPLLENGSLTKNPLAQVVERLPSVVPPCFHAAAWVAAGISGSLLRCVHAVRRPFRRKKGRQSIVCDRYQLCLTD